MSVCTKTLNRANSELFGLLQNINSETIISNYGTSVNLLNFLGDIIDTELVQLEKIETLCELVQDYDDSTIEFLSAMPILSICSDSSKKFSNRQKSSRKSSKRKTIRKRIRK